MSDNSNLSGAVRVAIAALRQVADSLEAALDFASHAQARNLSFRPSVASDSREWDVVSQSAPVASFGPPCTEFSGYHQVSQLLTAVPDHCLELCNRLGRDKKERAQRAWEAGLWARATLEGKIAKPRPTPKINIQAAVYLVVRGPGVVRPTVAFSAAEYYKILPKFTEDSLSHSFPSKAEARVYCLAAGIDPPEQL